MGSNGLPPPDLRGDYTPDYTPLTRSPDLAALAEVWDTLPDHIRAAIQALAGTATAPAPPHRDIRVPK